MDAEILHARLAAAEGAIIKTDERLDALETSEQAGDHADALVAHDERLTACEEVLQACLTKLQSMEATASETEARVAEAEAVVAVAEAQEAQAEAAVAVAEAEMAAAEDTETPLVEEIPTQEPESEGEAGPASKPKSSNWLERLIALR